MSPEKEITLTIFLLLSEIFSQKESEENMAMLAKINAIWEEKSDHCFKRKTKRLLWGGMIKMWYRLSEPLRILELWVVSSNPARVQRPILNFARRGKL
jgi:hypothetical protein